MILFRLDSSIRTDGSVSREIADTLQRAYTDEHPRGVVVRRDLRTDPIAAEVWAVAALGSFTPTEHAPRPSAMRPLSPRPSPTSCSMPTPR